MDHPTTSTVLTWITFAPLLGAAAILGVLLARSAGLLTKNAADEVSRWLALISSGV